jgi:hypothetical protein
MNLDEIKKDYFEKALDASQRSVFSGLIVCMISVLFFSNSETYSSYKIPIIEIEVTSKGYAATALFSLYVFFGFHCFFNSWRAVKIHDSVNDKTLSSYLKNYPNLILSDKLFRSCLYAIFFVAAYVLCINAFDLTSIRALISAFFVDIPYFIALKIADEIE